MKLIVSIFLVYKVKKCLLKSGNVKNIELKKRLAAMEQELHEAKMAAAAYNKMIDIAERLYKIPVRKKSGPKQ